MNYEFNKREIALILVLVAVLMGLMYYQFIYCDIQDKKAKYDTTDIDNEVMIEQSKLMKINSMEAEIAANTDSSEQDASTGYVETYDNLKAEINLLNDIFADAATFNLSFEQATAVDDAVRRNISVTFTASSYKVAKEIITKLHDAKYRCLIRNISINSQGGQNAEGIQNELDLNNGPVSVSLTVEFFETLYEAKSLDGLDIQGAQTSDDQSLTDTLAAQTDTYENLE